ncbi:MAG: hypothetical protein WC326_12990 [Candidatus Delongbacteria bacterium]
MEPGPIRYRDLPDDFLLRAELVFHAIEDAGLMERTDFLVNFQREIHPMRELMLWERLAVAYRSRWRNRAGSVAERKSWLTLLLLASSGATAHEGDLTGALELEEARLAFQEAATAGRNCLSSAVDARAVKQSTLALAAILSRDIGRAIQFHWNQIDRLLESEAWEPDEVEARLRELHATVDELADERENLSIELNDRSDELEAMIQGKREILERERREELLRQSSLGNLFGEEN